MPRSSIDLSADLGELPGEDGRRLDRELIARVSTAHLATGAHAGDKASMARGAEACAASATRLGAHPSYPDRDGFGRRRLSLSPGAVAASLLDQLGALEEAAAPSGLAIESIKPHGQLYHDLSDDEELARTVFHALARRSTKTFVVLAAGSHALSVATELGLRVVAEGFCDRAYDERGRLVDRGQPGAMLREGAQVGDQVRQLVTEGLRVEGAHVEVTSLCVHSDGPDALGAVASARAALDDLGVAVAAPVL